MRSPVWMNAIGAHMNLGLALTISIVSLIVAVFSVGASLSQAKGVEKSTEATIFLSFSDRYNSDAMRDALRFLVGLYSQHESKFPGSVLDAFRDDEQMATRINDARRLVSRFYFDIARLYRAKLISRALAKALLANNGLNVFYKICEPLNELRDRERVRAYSKTLVRLVSRYNHGSIRHQKSRFLPTR